MAGQDCGLPRLFAAQPLNCSPVDASFEAGVHTGRREVNQTIAEGTAIKDPLRLGDFRRVTRDGGVTAALTEDAIVAALRRLARRACLPSPPAPSRPRRSKSSRPPARSRPSEITVVVLTGSGLKAATTVADLVQ